MKKILLTVLFANFFAFAQKELWGGDDGAVSQTAGLIGKYGINGENGSVVHSFITNTQGSKPLSELFTASNEKIYGTTYLGGPTSVNNDGRGVLYEYDFILNKYRVVHNLTERAVNSINSTKFIEPIPGILYCATNNVVFKLELANNSVTYLNGVADYFITGSLVKAANGHVYGSSMDVALCPNVIYVGQINPGTIIKIDMSSNSIQKVYQLPCDYSNGLSIRALVEVTPNKLIGIAAGGGIYGKGTLFEFNTLNNTLTKKIDFDGETMGENPVDLIDGGNGKLYGVCQNGGPAAQFWKKGTLFEYTIATNTINTLFNFGDTDSNGFETFESPISLLKTSTGNLVGLCNQTKPFLYNLSTNQMTQTCVNNCNVYGLQNLIEICRKPSYQEFVVNTFAPEVGTAFNYNINNDNATTFVWKKGNTVLPLQISGTLNFASVSLSDSGVYNCTMTNECGITVTMNLTINVSNLSVETIEDYRTLIALYPNPSKGNINIKYPENRGVKGLKYKITNLLGQTILENDIVQKPNMTEIAIETAGFANGVYQVTLITDKGNWYGKFVKK